MRLRYWLPIALVACDASPAAVETKETTGSRATHLAPHSGESESPPLPGVQQREMLDAVATVHGGTGPWAMLGYRMGRFALDELGLERGSFDLEVEHHSPREVQYSCVADGAAAATGASLGKLNLSWHETAGSEVHTLYRRKSTGAELVLRPTETFESRFRDVPREELAEAGRRVLALSDQELFEKRPSPAD